MIQLEKAYKFRTYPNKAQQELIEKTFGCTRFVYNYFLNRRIEEYKKSETTLSFYDCSKELTILKQELEWLKEPEKCSLQNSLKDLDSAYKNFFRKVKQNKGKTGFPKFKSKKHNKKSYRTNNTFGSTQTKPSIEYLETHIKLPKLGKVKIRGNLVPKGRILNATVSKTHGGKYFVSLCCTDVEIQPLPQTSNSIGIDLGLKEFCITSDGQLIENPKYFHKSQKKLAKLQRSLSRKTIGSKNRNKVRLKVARQHEKISNQRKDFLHKLSTEIVTNYDLICIESLQVSNMLKNHKLSKAISDVSWYEFTRQLEYKSNWYGKYLVKVDRFFPSSQLCSVCGYQNPNTKDLSVREWECSECNSLHDRDINAAINILNEGIRLISK